MGDQLNYLNNLNRPNLVDIALLQKINDGYHFTTPKVSYLYSMIQTAGSKTCSLAKDNLFITVIVVCLILFLAWCYVEKQRQDAIFEKYLQKRLAKSLLNEELNLFTETPDPINIEKLFTDINDTIKPNPEHFQDQEPNQVQVPESVQEPNQFQKSELKSGQNVYMTKRERNLELNEQRKPIQVENEPIAGNVSSSKFMNVNNFNMNSYMLM
jgi:hypothetical protein